VTDAPPPIPAEGIWSGDPADLPNWDAMPRRNRRRKRRGHYPIWLKYLAWCVGAAMLVTAAQIAFHAVRSDPRDATLYATRQLKLSVMRPGERLLATVNVAQRPAIDYFRATRGVLVLTDKRMVFLGLRPRDLLAPADAPPTFDERDFPLDTLVAVETGRTFAWLTKAIIVRTPNETLRLGVPSNAWPEAAKLASEMTGRRQNAHVAGVTQEAMRKTADAEWKRAVDAWKKPQYYTVRRGDALGSIATQWNTTPDELIRLNKLPDNRIRVGQTILVRQAM
jgi:hypothetical protein